MRAVHHKGEKFNRDEEKRDVQMLEIWSTLKNPFTLIIIRYFAASKPLVICPMIEQNYQSLFPYAKQWHIESFLKELIFLEWLFQTTKIKDSHKSV